MTEFNWRTADTEETEREIQRIIDGDDSMGARRYLNEACLSDTVRRFSLFNRACLHGIDGPEDYSPSIHVLMEIKASGLKLQLLDPLYMCDERVRKDAMNESSFHMQYLIRQRLELRNRAIREGLMTGRIEDTDLNRIIVIVEHGATVVRSR
jgi:hypothetical protein